MGFQVGFQKAFRRLSEEFVLGAQGVVDLMEHFADRQAAHAGDIGKRGPAGHGLEHSLVAEQLETRRERDEHFAQLRMGV